MLKNYKQNTHIWVNSSLAQKGLRRPYPAGKIAEKQFRRVYFWQNGTVFCLPIQQKHTPQTCFLSDFSGWVHMEITVCYTATLSIFSLRICFSIIQINVICLFTIVVVVVIAAPAVALILSLVVSNDCCSWWKKLNFYVCDSSYMYINQFVMCCCPFRVDNRWE